MYLTDWVKLVFLSVLWGGSFFFVEVGLTQLPSFTVVTLRLGLAALVLWSVVFFTHAAVPQCLNTWLALVALGALNNAIPFSLIVWGQTQITAGLASILNATTPLFAVMLASFLLPDERGSINKLVGVLIGFSGVAVMFSSSAVTGSSPLLPKLAVLFATFCYALAGVYARRALLRQVNSLVSAAGQIGMAFLLLVPLAWYLEGVPNFGSLSLSVWGAIFSLAVLSTALAYILYFNLLKSVGTTNVLLVTLLVPVSAISLGVIVLHESLQLTQIIGMLMIGFGLLVIDGRLGRYFVSLLNRR